MESTRPKESRMLPEVRPSREGYDSKDHVIDMDSYVTVDETGYYQGYERQGYRPPSVTSFED